MKYIPLFILIQVANFALMPVGWVLCVAPETTPWLWSNDDDADLIETMHPWDRYVYLAWRNPVSNLRHLPGVSKPGRPLWHWSNGRYYAQAGWLGKTGYPVLSAGAGQGY